MASKRPRQRQPLPSPVTANPSPSWWSTPRGRRRVSLLIILAGLVVSHLYHTESVHDSFNPSNTVETYFR